MLMIANVYDRVRNYFFFKQCINTVGDPLKLVGGDGLFHANYPAFILLHCITSLHALTQIKKRMWLNQICFFTHISHLQVNLQSVTNSYKINGFPFLNFRKVINKSENG